tara:strand:+ start:91 stop:405 length:315 start_codon:yes stop_codon:yes gene_type:complete
MIPFEQAEQRVINFYRHRATVSDIGAAFAYMNCIKVVDYITGPSAFNNTSMDPSFIVTETENDSIQKHDHIKWHQADDYITNLLRDGSRDDIECLHCFLDKKLQ